MNSKFQIPSDVRKNMEKSVQNAFQDFTFRKVKRLVFPAESTLLSVKFSEPKVTSSGGVTISSIDIDPKKYQSETYSSAQKDKNLEFSYNMYAGFTAEEKLRDNDKHKGSIYFSSNNYRQLDVVNGSFCPGETQEFKSSGRIPPRVGDLICMKVEMGPKGKLWAKWWFTASEQFLHAWTLIMYANHPSFDRKDLYKRSFTGNRLQTNSFLKYTLSHKDNGAVPDEAELSSRYFRLRTEYVSKKWVHVYCALVLIVRFGELPHAGNIPNNIGGLKMMKWDLPYDFVRNLLGMHSTYFDAIPKENPMNCNLESIIFESADGGVESDTVFFDRPAIVGEKVEKATVIPKLEDQSEFPSLPKSTAPPRVEKKNEHISFSWEITMPGNWAEITDDDDSFYKPAPIKEEEPKVQQIVEEKAPAQKDIPVQKEAPVQWFDKFEKIKIIMEEENVKKFDKISKEMEKKYLKKLEEKKKELEEEFRKKLEIKKKELDEELMETLNKIKADF